MAAQRGLSQLGSITDSRLSLLFLRCLCLGSRLISYERSLNNGVMKHRPIGFGWSVTGKIQSWKERSLIRGVTLASGSVFRFTDRKLWEETRSREWKSSHITKLFYPFIVNDIKQSIHKQ